MNWKCPSSPSNSSSGKEFKAGIIGNREPAFFGLMEDTLADGRPLAEIIFSSTPRRPENTAKRGVTSASLNTLPSVMIA